MTTLRSVTTELNVFGRFHVRSGDETAMEVAVRNVILATRIEPGCIGIEAFRSTVDPTLFFIRSSWRNEAAFDAHARLPHTLEFLETVTPLLTHELDIARTTRIA